MIALSDSRKSASHWIDNFLSNPEPILADFISGYADLGAFAPEDPVEAAIQIFGDLPRNHDGLSRLDFEIEEWLNNRRQAVELSTKSNRIALEAIDVLQIVSALDLVESARELRKNLLLWMSWTNKLSAESGMDVSAYLFGSLAQCQELVADEDGILAHELEPLWLGLCSGAGSKYPSRYLSIGLSGLRNLPERQGLPRERPWLYGLSQWACAQLPTTSEFMLQWKALKSIYPRSRAYWQSALMATLAQDSARDLPESILNAWKSDVDLNEEVEFKLKTDRVWSLLGNGDAVKTLISRIESPLSQIKDDIARIVGNREAFAIASGASYYFVSTCCNIGMKLIKSGPEAERRDRAILAESLARKALRWEPDSVYAWALWRDSLENQDLLLEAELIGWETIRRFPENEQWRNQLATMMMYTLGRLSDTEQLLRETIRRFPHDPVASCQLCEILINSGREHEASAIVDAIEDNGRADEATFSLKARLDCYLKGRDVAIATLQRAIRNFPTGSLGIQLEKIVGGASLPFFSATTRAIMRGHSLLVSNDSSLPVAFSRGGRLRKIVAELPLKSDNSSWRGSANKYVHDALNLDPFSSYAQYVSSLLVFDDKNQDESKVFPLAFISAMQAMDRSKFDKLKVKFPLNSQIVNLAMAFLFQDQMAATEVSKWISVPVASDSRANSAIRSFLKMRVSRVLFAADLDHGEMNGDFILRVVAGNDNVRMDLIEAVLCDGDMLLAA